ncbi:hypothetical protein Tco_0567637 [Tanacetum coccineum]
MTHNILQPIKGHSPSFFFAEASPATAFPGSSVLLDSRISIVQQLSSVFQGWSFVEQWKVFKQWKPWQCEKTSVAKRYLVKSFEESEEVFPGVAEK